MSTLSVCIITKNEEKNIRRCLNSVEIIADEIIIVDTGSTDKTIDIAKDFLNVKLYNYEWNNNFSDARNFSISHATKDWILYIDADEQIEKKDIKKLKNLINNEKKEAISFRLINIIEGNEYNDSYTVRLFKRNDLYKFKGKIHEKVVESIFKIHGPDCVKESDIKLYHYGYDEKTFNIKEKIKRNLDILYTVDEKEKDGFYYYNLAMECFRMNEYELALKYYTLGEITKSSNDAYKLNIAIYKALCFSNLNRLDLAINHLDMYINLFPDYKDLYFYRALCYADMGKYDKAYNNIMIYINTQKGIYPDLCFEKKYNINELLKLFENNKNL